MTLAQELESLEQLHHRGALTETEFAQAKARLLQAPATTATAHNTASLNGLRRSNSDRWIGGVCGGLAQLTGMDAWLWRLLFAMLVILAGTGLLFYVLVWILVPVEPNAHHQRVSIT